MHQGQTTAVGSTTLVIRAPCTVRNLTKLKRKLTKFKVIIRTMFTKSNLQFTKHEGTGMYLTNAEIILCDFYAEKKRKMFEEHSAKLMERKIMSDASKALQLVLLFHHIILQLYDMILNITG